jgi:beta-glucanase (GH16 family)
MSRITIPVIVAALFVVGGCTPKPATEKLEKDVPASLHHASFLSTRGEDWKLIWHDEFDGKSLDASKWKIGLPWGGTDGEGRHHDNRYASYIMDHNVVVEDGVLKLFTRREDVTAKNLRTFQYTEGLVTTSASFRHRYGYWEARVKIPVDAGPGMWPAFWTLSQGWPPEMDICEVWTSTSKSHQGLCYRPAPGAKEKWDDTTSRAPLPRGWTTFGMEWGPGYQVYNVNGNVTKRIYADHVPDDEHYILLNSGVESTRPPTADTVFPNAFEVDYVRVYARPDVVPVHNNGFEEPEGLVPWSVTGRFGRAGDEMHGGEYALRFTGPGSASQKVYGLRPNTTYTLSGWAKVRGGSARLGIRDFGGEGEQFAPTNSPDYRHLIVEFTTGPTATTAVIFCAVPHAAEAAFFDDIAVRPK